MKDLSLLNIAEVTGGRYIGPDELLEREVSEITTDSRTAKEGCLFIAIRGNRADGHDFAPQVHANGALAILAEREIDADCGPYILVNSTEEAATKIARFYLSRLAIPVVGITGSVGKTSTKEMIAHILSERYRVLATKGNFNNALGLPLTIFRATTDDEIAVLEMGISDFGEMDLLADIARPETCVITNIQACHLEQLGDLDGVLRAKTEIFSHMRENACVILNGDDGKLATVENACGTKPVFFGLSDARQIYADRIKSRGLAGISCRIHTGEGEMDVQIPLPGIHAVYNALAGTAVGLRYGLSLDEIKAGIETIETIGGRFRIVETADYTLIDDCYNANPTSMKASLSVLAEAEGRKVAVLGDMGELGEDADALHEEVGRAAAEYGIDALYLAGDKAALMAEAARSADGGMEVRHFATRDDLAKELPALLKKGDVVLVKASHFMGFEALVKQLS